MNYCNKCNKVADDEQKQVNSPVVYNNVILKDSSASLAVFSNDLINDPTLMSTKGGGKPCSKCGAQDAVFFMSHSQKKGQEMSLVFICKNCQHIFAICWIHVHIWKHVYSSQYWFTFEVLRIAGK